ncbi:MAG: methyltransferase family protein [Promethearchaeota archaeon]
MDRFLAKIPAFSGFKIIFLIIYVILVIFINISILRFFSSVPIIFPELGIYSLFFPILGFILMEIIGLLLVYQLWARRVSFKERYGALSYQRVLLAGFGGVSIILSLAVFNIASFLIWQDPQWPNSSLQFLVTPLLSLIPNFELFFNIFRYFFSIFFILIGLLIVIRAVQIFGFDYMAVIYLYFPEESEIQNHEIYSLLRHPAYSAAILISLGGVLLNQNIYAIIFWVIHYFGFYIHIHFVEEKELVQRFGDSYLEYRKKVPAFFVKPENYLRFLKFVFTRKID